MTPALLDVPAPASHADRSGLAVACGELAPTRTYAVRSWAWVSTGTGCVTHGRGKAAHRIPALGKLTIKQQAAAGWGRAIDLTTYAVDEVAPEHPGTRLFLFFNLGDPAHWEPYKVTVGGVETCRCKAGRCRVPVCKHRDAALSLIHEGLI